MRKSCGGLFPAAFPGVPMPAETVLHTEMFTTDCRARATTSGISEAAVSACAAPGIEASASARANASLAGRTDRIGLHRIAMDVAETRADEGHDRGDLRIAHHARKARHRAGTVQHNRDRERGLLQPVITGKRRIAAGTFRAAPVRHVAALADIAVEAPSILRQETPGVGKRRILRMCRDRRHEQAENERRAPHPAITL